MNKDQMRCHYERLHADDTLFYTCASELADLERRRTESN